MERYITVPRPAEMGRLLTLLARSAATTTETDHWRRISGSTRRRTDADIGEAKARRLQDWRSGPPSQSEGQNKPSGTCAFRKSVCPRNGSLNTEKLIPLEHQDSPCSPDSRSPPGSPSGNSPLSPDGIRTDGSRRSVSISMLTAEQESVLPMQSPPNVCPFRGTCFPWRSAVGLRCDVHLPCGSLSWKASEENHRSFDRTARLWRKARKCATG